MFVFRERFFHCIIKLTVKQCMNNAVPPVNKTKLAQNEETKAKDITAYPTMWVEFLYVKHFVVMDDVIASESRRRIFFLHLIFSQELSVVRCKVLCYISFSISWKCVFLFWSNPHFIMIDDHTAKNSWKSLFDWEFEYLPIKQSLVDILSDKRNKFDFIHRLRFLYVMNDLTCLWL